MPFLFPLFVNGEEVELARSCGGGGSDEGGRAWLRETVSGEEKVNSGLPLSCWQDRRSEGEEHPHCAPLSFSTSVRSIVRSFGWMHRAVAVEFRDKGQSSDANPI